MSGYTKLFSSILDSTIWQEAKETRLVWIAMLCMKSREQVVEASVPGLAARAGVALAECEKALKKLAAPDQYSRTKAHEGRRIEPIEGGWRILNGELYRNRMSKEERREYNRLKQREYRAKKRGKPLPGEAAYVKAAADGLPASELDRIVDNSGKGQTP